MVVRVIFVALVAAVVVTFFVPSLRQAVFKDLFTSSEIVTVPATGSADAAGEGGGAVGEEQQLKIVTLLGFDAIPAILDPTFVSAEEAAPWMDSNEHILGLSINGDHRAYSVRMLSRHEIVNDVVGGVPVAVTW